MTRPRQNNRRPSGGSSGPRASGKVARVDPVRAKAVDLLMLAETERVPLTGPMDAAVGEIPREQDRAFLRNLVLQTMRHRLRLDTVLGKFLRAGGVNSLDDAVRQVLRIGAAQALIFDAVPPHAVVATSVDLASHFGHRGTAGLTNAVLRKVVRQGQREWDALSDLPQTVAGLSVRFSHPEWMIERWLARFGLEETVRILNWNLEMPEYWLRLAPGAEAPAGTEPGWIPGTARCPAGPMSMPGFFAGDFAIQDGSGILVGNLPPSLHGSIIDLCAAPGTKSVHLSERAVGEPESHITALDLSPGRLDRMRSGLRRTQRPEMDLAVAAGADIPVVRPWNGILIDAPCSNLGVLRRRVDAKWRSQAAEIPKLAERQRELLEAAAEGVAPGGWLLYSVCTIEPEETVDQFVQFRERHPDFSPAPFPEWIPKEIRGEPGELVLRPGQVQTDGGYAFVVMRGAED